MPSCIIIHLLVNSLDNLFNQSDFTHASWKTTNIGIIDDHIGTNSLDNNIFSDIEESGSESFILSVINSTQRGGGHVNVGREGIRGIRSSSSIQFGADSVVAPAVSGNEDLRAVRWVRLDDDIAKRAAAEVLAVKVSFVDLPVTSEGDELSIAADEEEGGDNEELHNEGMEQR